MKLMPTAYLTASLTMMIDLSIMVTVTPTLHPWFSPASPTLTLEVNSTRQSTSGYLLYLNGQLFHWRGRTERLIITATAAGEYIALSRGNQASKHVNAVMKFFGNHSPHNQPCPNTLAA
jgi:hypothetical protein